MSERCPCCGEKGENLPELSDNLRACMNIEDGCRVNEFEVRDYDD